MRINGSVKSWLPRTAVTFLGLCRLCMQVLCAFCVFFLVACTPSDSMKPVPPKAGKGPGEQTGPDRINPSCGDCGGGETRGSTPELVQKILKNALADYPTWVLQYELSYHSSDRSKTSLEFFNRLSQAYNQHKGAFSEEQKTKWSDYQLAYVALNRESHRLFYARDLINPKWKEHLIQQFIEEEERQGSQNPVIQRKLMYAVGLLMDQLQVSLEEDCKLQDGHQGHVHKSAVISNHSFPAKICFSLNELKKVAPGSLKVEVLSLIHHEFSHALGFDEQKAAYLQEDFARMVGFIDAEARVKKSPELELQNAIYLIPLAQNIDSAFAVIEGLSSAIMTEGVRRKACNLFFVDTPSSFWLQVSERERFYVEPESSQKVYKKLELSQLLDFYFFIEAIQFEFLFPLHQLCDVPMIHRKSFTSLVQQSFLDDGIHSRDYVLATKKVEEELKPALKKVIQKRKDFLIKMGTPEVFSHQFDQRILDF